MLNQALDDFGNIPKKNINSYDVNDFEINFLRGLSLEDGASTITDFTCNIITDNLSYSLFLPHFQINYLISNNFVYFLHF